MFDIWTLSIADIVIELLVDHSIHSNEEFDCFMSKGEKPDVSSTFYRVEKLPVFHGENLYTDRLYSMVMDESGNLIKYFKVYPEDMEYSAAAIYDSTNKRVRVEYLEVYLRCVSELQNCFYHLGFESILLDRNKLCLHASCIETPLGGILFSGVSGIGKSTQADLWCRYRDARYINGDRPILSKENNGWLAWGSPYAGSSKHYVNDNTPVTAIMLLKQSRTCSLRRLTPAEAFRGIWAGLTVHTWDPAFVEKASALAIDLISAVPVFEFSCTPDENAVNALEQALRKELNL